MYCVLYEMFKNIAPAPKVYTDISPAPYDGLEYFTALRDLSEERNISSSLEDG